MRPKANLQIRKPGGQYRSARTFYHSCKNGPIIHYRGQPIKKIRTAWQNALKRAGITRRLRPYDLRHRFVTAALTEGADIKAISDIVGSAPQTLIKHYQHVTREIHRKTVACIPSIKVPIGIKQKPKNKPGPTNISRTT